MDIRAFLAVQTFAAIGKTENLRTIITAGQFLVSGASGRVEGRLSEPGYMLLHNSLCYFRVFRDQAGQKLSNVIQFC